MKGTSFLVGASLFAAALFYGQARTLAGQETRLSAPQISSIRRAVLAPQNTTLTLVAQKFTGTFDTVEKEFETFKAECIKQKVYDKISGKPDALLILNEDPTGKASFSFSIGLSIPTKVAVASPLSIEQFNLPKTVRTTHVGAYSDLKLVHSEIKLAHSEIRTPANVAKTTTSWPVIMRLDSNPKYPNIDPRLSGAARTRAMGVLKKEVQTELIVPVK